MLAPAAAEAFQFSGHDSFIKPDNVMRARKAKLEGIGPLVIGADPARFGDDRFSLAWRQGRKVTKIESWQKVDTVAGANWLKQVIDIDKPARVFIGHKSPHRSRLEIFWPAYRRRMDRHQRRFCVEHQGERVSCTGCLPMN